MRLANTLCRRLQHVLQEVLEPGFGRVVDDLGTTLFHHNAAVHEYDLVGDLAGEADLVRDNDHGHAITGKAEHNVQHFAHQFGVECRCRLVEEHDLRLHGQRAGDGHTLLLTARQL